MTEVEGDQTEQLKQYLLIQKELLERNGNFTKINGYYNIAHFVHDNGIGMSVPTDDYFALGEMKECFFNAFDLVQRNSSLIYVEGYACGIIPVHHAWCLDLERKVIETTWTDDHRDAYYGIPMDFDYVKRAVFRKKTYGVIDDWKNRWPIFGDDKSEWMHADFLL